MWTSFHHLRFSGGRRKRAPRGPVSPKGLSQGGFTLIELMAVLAIMTILTTVFLFQQKRFDSSTLLRSLAYSVALTVRQAQVYGSSVREFQSNFTYSYGVNFNADPSNYYLFADANSNKIYDTPPAAAVDETVQKFKIGSGYSISKFCGILSSGNQSCTSGGTSGTVITALSIYFKRPNPDAQFSTLDVNGNQTGETYCAAYVQIQGPGGDTRAIKITTTGQIQIGALNASISGC